MNICYAHKETERTPGPWSASKVANNYDEWIIYSEETGQGVARTMTTRADALVMLCPNYNDALSANLTAFINRLTALFRTGSFHRKQLFAVVVSGYSGGDIVARQIVSALSMNKGFILPPGFALMVTANDRGTAVQLPDIQPRLTAYAAAMRSALGLSEEPT